VINIDITLVIQFVNFIILMVILNQILYRPLRRALQKRKETIEGNQQAAVDLEAQIEEKMARYEQQLQDAKLKGNQERTAMRQAAAEEESKVLGLAHQEASASLQQIKVKVAGEATAAREALKAETSTLADLIASKVLGRALK
jgi:F-type H+-transporting ATPase subunit b